MKINRLHLTFILLQVLLLGVFSQEIRLKGRVLDAETNYPLKGAEIYLSSSNCGTVSDADGNFELNCPASGTSDSLIISFIGYQNFVVSAHDISSGTVIKLTPKSLNLEEIVVSAERTDIIKQDIPHAKNTLKFEEIELYGGSELSDVLKPIPSVRIEGNDLDGRQIQIRGSSADEVKVYYDGILLNNMRMDNAADLSIIPLESIETLEILKGANLTFYGNGAFGGVVNISSRKLSKQRIFVKGKLGTYQSRYLLSEVSIPIKKNFYIQYFGQINGWSPEIEFFPGERFSDKTENKQITTNKQNHNISLNYFPQAGQLNSRFISYHLDYDKPFWNSQNENYLSALSYKGSILGIHDFDLSFSHLFSNNKISRNPAGSAQYINIYQSNRVNARLAKKFTYKTAEFQFLTEYFHDDLLADSRLQDVAQEINFYHAYLYDNRFSLAGVVQFNDYLKELPILSWKTFLGTRADILANGDRDVSHTVGAQVEYRREYWTLKPYFNFGQNVKYPTLQENAYLSDIIDFTRSDSTRDRLKPEYNTSAELGIVYSYFPRRSIYRSVDLTISLFSRTVFNKLLTRPFDDFIASIQIGRNKTRGLEASIKFNEIFSRLFLHAAYVQLDISDPLLYAYKPDKNMSVHLKYASGYGFYFTSTFFYEGESLAWFYDENSRIQTEEILAYQDMDISAGIKIPLHFAEADLQLSGHNIFDSSGFRYYYLKKRYWQLSLSFTY